MANTTQHINARGDSQLTQRFVAKAEQLGIENAAAWVQSRMGQLVTQLVDGNQTVSDVYAYADSVRQEHLSQTPELPGANLGAVTDVHLTTAINAMRPEEPS